jgi:hypothetical protein
MFITGVHSILHRSPADPHCAVSLCLDDQIMQRRSVNLEVRSVFHPLRRENGRGLSVVQYLKEDDHGMFARKTTECLLG